MTAASTVSTDLLDPTPPAGDTRDPLSLWTAMVLALNQHAGLIDGLVSGGSPTIAAMIVGTPTISVAAQASTHRIATVTLKDGGGNTLAAPALARIWISDAAGGAPTASAPAGGVTISTGTSEDSITANKVIDAISTAGGLIGVTLTDATGSINTTWYVNVAIGNQIVSAAVNITNA